MGLKKQAVQGSLINTIRSLLETGAGFTAFLVFARWLQPEHFGQYALASAFVALAKTGLDLGFARALIQRENLTNIDRNTTFWTILSVGTVLTVLFWFGVAPILEYFNRPEVGSVLAWLSISLFLHGLSDTARALLVRDLAFGFVAGVSVTATLLGAGLGIFMAVTGWGVWSLVGYQLTITTVGVMGFWSGVSWFPGVQCSRDSFREFWDFGIHVVGKKFLNIFGERTDDLLVGFFMGSTILGYYAVAYRVLKLARQLLVRTLINVAIPVFSRLQADAERLRNAFLSAVRVATFVAVPAFVGLGLLADSLVPLLFGEKWIPAVPILIVLIGAGIVDAVLLFHSPVLIAKARTDQDMMLTGLKTVMLVGLFLSAVHVHILAVAVAYVLASLLLLPVAYVAVKNLVSIRPMDYVRSLAPAFTGTVGVVMAVVGFQYQFGAVMVPLWNVVFGIGIGVIGFFVMSMVIVPAQCREMVDLARLSVSGSGRPGDVFSSREDSG